MPYPPGISAGSARAPWNEPHAHEHEFMPVEELPIIEDGAAIFHEECIYAEGEYGQGWQCEETRTYRFEYSTLETPSGWEINLPTIDDWNEVYPTEEKWVIRIEEAFHKFGPSDEVSFDVDPDPDCGQVTIEYESWKLHFEP